MRSEAALRIATVAAALVAAVTWSIAGNQAAEAGHTIAEGNCSLGPVCVSGYSGLGDQESFRVSNVRGDLSWWDGIYELALQETEIAWATAEGPQVPSNVQVADPNWVNLAYPNSYLKCPAKGDPLGKCTGPSDEQVDAYVCFVNEAAMLVCTLSATQPYNLEATAGITFVNTALIAGLYDPFVPYPFALKRHIISHEFGHTMLLQHHPGSDCLVEANHGPNTYVPQRCDLGFADPYTPGITAPCDGSSDDWGIRCIYNWWREQWDLAPSPIRDPDCHDLNRDGLVDLANDILGTLLLFRTPAQSQKYQPEADTNLDGEIDLANDILATILDFGPSAGHCDSAHYPGA